MALGALWCKNNADFRGGSKWQHCARYVYYSSEITTRTRNLKITVLLLIDIESNPPKHAQFAVGTLFDSSNIHSAWRLTYY